MNARVIAIAAAIQGWAACAPLAPVTQTSGPRSRAPAQAPSAPMLFERGRALAAQGDVSRAQQYLKLAIRAGYPEARAIALLVQVCIAGSRLREALEYASAFLRRNPGAWRLRYLVAAIDNALGRNQAAAVELQRVIAQQPEAAEAHYLLAVVQRDAYHDDGAARRSFGAYLVRDPHGSFAAEASAFLAEHPEPPAAAATPHGETP